jgi:hypothetical protein
MGVGRRLALAASTLAVLLACSTVLAVSAGARRPPPRPDLVVRSVSAPSRSTAGPGASLTVRVQVANFGGNRAPRSVADVTLDTARGLAHPGSGLKAGSLRVPALRPHKRFSATAHLKVPNDPNIEGTYYVDVCADAAKKIKESNERNNCRASRTGVIVSQPPATSLPVANSYPGLHGSGSFSFTSDPSVVRFQVVFNMTVDRIDLWTPWDASATVDSPRPAGCGSSGQTEQLNGRTYYLQYCDLYPNAVGPNTPISGTLRSDPGATASAGSGGYLYGSINSVDTQGGPFTLTGP